MTSLKQAKRQLRKFFSFSTILRSRFALCSACHIFISIHEIASGQGLWRGHQGCCCERWCCIQISIGPCCRRNRQEDCWALRRRRRSHGIFHIFPFCRLTPLFRPNSLPTSKLARWLRLSKRHYEVSGARANSVYTREAFPDAVRPHQVAHLIQMMSSKLSTADAPFYSFGTSVHPMPAIGSD